MYQSKTTIVPRQIRSLRWCSLAAHLSLACAAHAQFYAITELGTLGGTNATAYGINNHEQIVGAMQTAMGNDHAFFFDSGRTADLGTLGGSNSWACGINDDGWVVGGAELPMTNFHAFVCSNAWMNPTMLDLGTLGGSNSLAWMINRQGSMVGWAGLTNGSHHAFFRTNLLAGGLLDLGGGGGTNSEAYCLNTNQLVVGDTMMADGTEQPITYTNALEGGASMMTMSMGGMGGVGGQCWSVNDLGVTAGQAQMSGGNLHAFVSGNRGMMGTTTVDLGTLGGTNSIGYCLNNAGTVVGMAQMANGTYHAFMVTNALGSLVRMTDLNSLIPANSGWELMAARGINASGQIVGWGMHGGHTNAFLLTPVSTPVMMSLAPASQIVGPGTMLTMQMQMSASEPLTYQWLLNGSPIPGATSPALPLQAMNPTNAGAYTVIARNAMGTVAMSSAALSLFSIQLSNATPQLKVAGPAGLRFRLDYCDRLGSGTNWQSLTNFSLSGPMHQVSDVPIPGAGARSYRAVMLP